MDYLAIWSKMMRLLVSPDFLFILFLVLSFVTYKRFRTFSRNLFATVLIFLITLTFFPVGEWLINPLELRYKTNPLLPDKITGVIMLSGGEEVLLSRVWNQTEFDRSVERNLYFLNFMRRYPKAKFIYSGGGFSEYEGYSKKLMENMLSDFGLNVSQIVFETKSKNTLESARNLHNLITPNKKQKWILITSAWHMPRVKLLFNRHNWDVIPFPVDHLSQKNNLFRIKINFSENLAILKIAIKEWIGMMFYKITGN